MQVDIQPFEGDDYEKNYRPKIVDVNIEDFDYISLRNVLSSIIAPALISFKFKTKSTFRVEKEDVPEYLHSTFDKHGFSLEAQQYVLDKMIAAFNYINSEDSLFNLEKELYDEIQEGTLLFGKYFYSLWS